ncbi:MAG: Colicin V secretion protein CvaA [Burkholderia gladioli]|nr:MAG: Colicin V secretion protein CvaA [Burkholderia gladioli]
MSEDLFRAEVARRSDHSLGSIRLISPLSHHIWASLATLILLTILGLLWFGRYTRREHVEGSLVPTDGLITLSSRGPGVITQLNVTEGNAIKAGDVLMVVSGERTSERLGNTQAAVTAAVQDQQQRIDDDLRLARDIAEDQDGALRKQAESLVQQATQLNAQIGIVEKQRSSYTTLLAKIEPLVAKGYVSALQIQQQQAQALDAESQLKTLTRQRIEVTQQTATVRNQLAQLPLTTANKLNELRRQRAQGDQALAQSEAERSVTLRATHDGVVSSLLVKVGQAVSIGQPVLALVPKASRLEAQLMVPTQAVGFVHEGTAVALHYQAFPYQKFGVHRGVVTQVSRSALTPAEITAVLGQRTPEQALYRVMVQLEDQDVLAYGKREALVPGMGVDADLMLDRRRLIEWAFEPIYGMRQRMKDGQ